MWRTVVSPRQEAYVLCSQQVLPCHQSSTHFGFLWWEQKHCSFPMTTTTVMTIITYVRSCAKHSHHDDDVMGNTTKITVSFFPMYQTMF